MIGRTATITLIGGGLSCTYTVTQLPNLVHNETANREAYSVYETKVSARTTTIKEMPVKITDTREKIWDNFYNLVDNKNHNKVVNMKIHFRVPVTKAYNILMAYDGLGLTNTQYTSTGYGRIWSGKEPSIELDGEILHLDGQPEGGTFSPIGPKGLNLPEKGAYKIAAPGGGYLVFHGLATLDGTPAKPMNERNVFSSTGFIYSESLYPAHCTLASAKCAAGEDSDTAEQGGANLAVGVTYKDSELARNAEYNVSEFAEIPNVYYPQATLDYAWTEGTENVWMLSPTHFFGTYTTRLNKTRSKDVDTAMKDPVNGQYGIYRPASEFKGQVENLMRASKDGGKWNIP